MRPTVTEQLAGTCRILDQIVAPEIAGTPAAHTLRGLVDNLRMLSTAWSQVVPFLHHDNAATTDLLVAARDVVDTDLARRIDHVLAAPSPNSFDADTVTARNDALRALLADVVLVLDPGGDVYAAVAAHMLNRIRDYPLRMVPAMPPRGEGGA